MSHYRALSRRRNEPEEWNAFLCQVANGTSTASLKFTELHHLPKSIIIKGH
jgi:hypothetical protein